MSDDIPIIKPIKLKEYEVRQSKYNIASKLPIRSIILGPSGSSLRFALKEARSYIYNKNFVNSDYWSVIECILPIYTSEKTDILMNNLSRHHELFGKYLLS